MWARRDINFRNYGPRQDDGLSQKLPSLSERVCIEWQPLKIRFEVSVPLLAGGILTIWL